MPTDIKFREDPESAVSTLTTDPLMDLVPKYFLYVFSLFPQQQRVDKGSNGAKIIPACPPGARVSPPLRIPSIVPSPFFDPVTQTTKLDYMKGEFFAQDIVHPQIGNDWSVGQNLDDLGIFWSTNETPTDAEIAGARVKLEAYFRRMLTEASKLEVSGMLNSITPHMRMAADYFHEDRPWNKIYRRMASCFACGGDVKAGVIIHSCGAVQPGMWPDAIKAGLKTPEQAAAAGFPVEAREPEPEAPSTERVRRAKS